MYIYFIACLDAEVWQAFKLRKMIELSPEDKALLKRGVETLGKQWELISWIYLPHIKRTYSGLVTIRLSVRIIRRFVALLLTRLHYDSLGLSWIPPRGVLEAGEAGAPEAFIQKDMYDIESLLLLLRVTLRRRLRLSAFSAEREGCPQASRGSLLQSSAGFRCCAQHRFRFCVFHKSQLCAQTFNSLQDICGLRSSLPQNGRGLPEEPGARAEKRPWGSSVLKMVLCMESQP
jgi:hypothetical protein